MFLKPQVKTWDQINAQKPLSEPSNLVETVFFFSKKKATDFFFLQGLMEYLNRC